VRQVVRHRWRALDLEYLEPKVRGLAELMERPEILSNWEAIQKPR
jgi:hypothetical protein